MNLPEGHFLQKEKYRLNRVIGQGGFGITYLGVWNTVVKGALGAMKTNVPVCIKEYFFKDYCYRDQGSFEVKVHSQTGEKLFDKFKEKLIKEAKILSAVQHPHIVNVLEVFEENNTAYIVMEYIKGCSLKYMLDKEGVLTENKALKYIHQIGNALDFVHEKNIVHLDIKPSNILIDHNDHARLIDFGVSKRYDLEEQEISTTTLTLSKGFASIEQYDEDGTQTFSPCPDIYSLGATLYNLLTAIIPIESILRATKPMPAPSAYNFNITPKTEKVIHKAMEVKPEDRYASIKEMLASLDIPPYEFEINTLEEKPGLPEEDNTQARPSSGNNEENIDDITLVKIAADKPADEEEPKKPKKKGRRFLVAAVIVLCAMIGFAAYDYFMDDAHLMTGLMAAFNKPQHDTWTNNPIPADTTLLNPQDENRDEYVAPIDSAERQPDSTEQQPVIQTQQQTPATGDTGQKPVGNESKPSTSEPVATTNVAPQTTDTISTASNSANQTTDNQPLTQEEKDELEKEYQDLIKSAKSKMEKEVRDYRDEREDLLTAKEITRKIGIDSTEVDSLLSASYKEEEEQKKQERLAKYKTFSTYGDWTLAKEKDLDLYGGINKDDGEVIIPFIYSDMNRKDGFSEFIRKDNGKSDLYDDKGKRIEKELEPE